MCFRIITYLKSSTPYPLLSQVHYDLLIGADGVNSIVKAGLQARLPAGFVRRIKHGTVYTVGPCLADAKGELPQNTFIQFHCFAVSFRDCDQAAMYGMAAWPICNAECWHSRHHKYQLTAIFGK